MKMFRVTLIPMLLLSVGFVVSGCASIYDKNLGSKVESNNSAQVVNADVVDDKGTIVTLEGQKAEKLMLRYRTEKAAAPTEKLLKDIGN